MKLYTIKEVSEILQIDPETVRNYIRDNKLIAYKVGREWRIKQEELITFVDRGANYNG